MKKVLIIALIIILLIVLVLGGTFLKIGMKVI